MRKTNIDPPNRRASRTDDTVGQRKPTSRYASTTVTPWATTQPTHWAAITFQPSSGLCTSTKMLRVARTLPPISSALARRMRSRPWKNHSILMPWQTPQMVLAQNNASDGAICWVKRRENRAPAMHAIASSDLAPRTPEMSVDSRSGIVALARRLPRSRDIEAILHHAGDYIPDSLSKDDHSPTRWAQHMRKVRKRQQRQGVGARLYPIQRDHIVYEAAAAHLFGNPWLGVSELGWGEGRNHLSAIPRMVGLGSPRPDT